MVNQGFSRNFPKEKFSKFAMKYSDRIKTAVKHLDKTWSLEVPDKVGYGVDKKAVDNVFSIDNCSKYACGFDKEQLTNYNKCFFKCVTKKLIVNQA